MIFFQKYQFIILSILSIIVFGAMYLYYRKKPNDEDWIGGSQQTTPSKGEIYSYILLKVSVLLFLLSLVIKII